MFAKKSSQGEFGVKNDFSRGSVCRHVLMQAVPLTIAQLIQLLYNIVDRIYIGHLPGTQGEALTGVGLVFPIISMIAAFTNLFSMGGAPLFSIARGEGDSKKASTILNNTFTMLLVTAVVLMAVGYGFKRPILYLFGASDVTYPFANDYLTIYLLGTIFLMIGTGMNSFISAEGFPKTGMFIVISGAVINILLDPLFIFVFQMGVKGAAIATVISQFVSMILVLRFFHGNKTLYRISKKYMILKKQLVPKIMGLGLSGFIMAVTNSLVQIVCNITIGTYGGDLYIGIMTILNSVREIVNIAIVGITNGAQPVLGFNYGAGEYRRVKQAIRFTALIGFIYTTVVWACIMIFPDIFIRMFSDSTALLIPGRKALKYYFFGFFFMAFQFSGQSTFVALGKSKQAIFFSLLRKVIIVIPLTILLPKMWNFGVDGVYLAEPVSNIIGGLACFLTMLHVVWRELSEKEKNKIRKNGERNEKE
ncbi:MAG: MATE family efflux transporter [Clostridiales bacterium]|nr:MATE family efflux transporter [Clostridiales bacterium]